MIHTYLMFMNLDFQRFGNYLLNLSEAHLLEQYLHQISRFPIYFHLFVHY
jgi:hypothetical protein